MVKRKIGTVAAAALLLVAASACASELGDGWQPKFYPGLEAAGSVSWVAKAYKHKVGAIRMAWESGAMKFGAAKEVTTDLTGFIDWTIEAMVKSEGEYGYASVAMEFLDESGRSLGVSDPGRPTVAKEWRKLTWTISAPKSAKRYVLHVLSLNREPVMFAKIRATAKPGVDKGDIPFEVVALPAEWNKDWNGGTVKMLSFSDAPLPVSFFLKGEKKGRDHLKLDIDIPSELEIKDAYCPMGDYWERLSPTAEPFVTNGIDYIRYTFGRAGFYAALSPARYDVDRGCSCTLVIGPKAGGERLEKTFILRYRTRLGEGRGQEKAMELAFRPMPSDFRQAKDFPVFSWNNTDRHFSSDEVASVSLRAYEAAGIRSFRRTANGGRSFPRQKELAALCEGRPVPYIFSGRFGDVWRFGACGLDRKTAERIGARRAVSSGGGFAEVAKNKMCPEYFIRDPRLCEHLRGFIRSILSSSEVKDGDWVTFDMEPWQSATWCHCEECHKAFAVFAGLDHVPTAAETQTPALADKWANFRCMHNEKSVELLTQIIREYNPTLKCIDYDYIMPYGDEKGMRARRRACGKDTLANEKWLDGHLCSYYHKIGKSSFLAMRNDRRHLKKAYLPMAAIAGSGGYLRPGEVLNPRQIGQFARAAFVNGCRGYAFYSGVCYDGEILVEMMKAQDEIAKWEGLPWGKIDGKSVPTSDSDQFAFASTVKPDGTEVVALFNYDMESPIRVELSGKTFELAPLGVRFVEIPKRDFHVFQRGGEMMTTLMLAAVMNMGGVEVNGEWVTKTERREFADGYAERYVLPEGRRMIGGERTTWTLPADATVWYQPMNAGERGGYENPYETCAAGDVPEGTLLVLPVTAKLKDGTYLLITEADLVDYTDLVIRSRGNGTFVADYHAEKGPFEQTGRAVTPWRVTLVAKDLQTLVTSDIVRRLCPEPPAERAAKAAAFAKPGRCAWQWLPAGQPVYAEQRDWYDRTKALGFEYYLVDGGWKKWRDGDRDEWACLKEVVDYGLSIGVKTAIWVHSKEIPTPEARLAYLRKVKASGAVGIKIDYIPKCDVNWCHWYEETLRDTYELGLFVDFHGCVKPTGRERTWPHELAREAIRGHEWHITRYNRVLPFEHDTILPFCRLVQGHGDYTPMVFEPRELIRFTWARQLAQGIVFSAPFLCFGDFPKNYQENPAADLIRSLPSVYDEVRVLSGSEIGVCAAFAKRKGDTWYLAIENGATPRRFAVDLSFLKGACRAETFGDAPTRLDGMVKTKYAVKPTDTLQVDLRAGGGYAARLVQDDGAGPVLAPYVAPLTDETAEEKAARMAWWTDARFGMFIHFGLYAMPARHEWIKKLETIPEAHYDEYFKRFDPDLFDAKAWAKAAKKAGMKYAVLTTKHHEGFCLWDSKVTDYKITKTPFGRDLVREFVEAFRAEGLHVGFYYSLIDWHHPDFTVDVNHPRRPKTAENFGTRGDGEGTYDEINASRDMAKYRQYMKDQVRELMTEYGKIDIVWFDFSYPERDRGIGPGKGREDWDSAGLVRLARSLQPQVLIDDRLDLSDVPGGWDFVSPEQIAVVKRPTVNGAHVPWEACQTFSGSWGYHRDEATWKSDETVLSLLVGAVSKGGNLILNVGPTARGEFDARAMAKLDMLGGWMRGNARSIYGCTIAPDRFAAPEGTKLTWNPKTCRLYVHLFEYPFKRLELAFGGEVAYAQFLHDGSELPVKTGLVGKHSGDERTATYVEIPQICPPVKVPVIEIFLKD